jgi:hypothetical protein
MGWSVAGFEITTNDLFDVWLSNGHIEIELLGFVDLNGSLVTLSGCHIQGPGPNTVGSSMLREISRWVMELLDVDEVRIEGAARTSGANPGRRPAPLVFRRVGNVDPAARRQV